jgi:methylenetetrahydrofolate dehydrogenase (NADP+)/methenyltetrahydrofolate cyclohydrolase
MERIDGKALAASIRAQVKQDIDASGLHPKLAVLLIGDDPASNIYVNLKEKACAEAGIVTDTRRMPATTSDADIIALIGQWNADETVDAILVQIPLPPGHDEDAAIAAMDPRKDVDGFHPENAAAILNGTGTLFPPVHEGILRLIGATDVTLKTSTAVVIANSDTFADPLVRLLTTAGCDVEKFRPDDMDREAVKTADIVVVAVGRPRFLTRAMIKPGACVIDVGTNRTAEGKTVGDADAEGLKDVLGWLSPVPGGVGPMTVALLLKNTYELAKRRRGIT